MLKLIADHMENGFLDNIIDMFKHDKSLYQLIGALLADERSRVRIGVVALVETLQTEDKEHIIKAIPNIAKLLKDENPTIRGDAAYLLGIIGHSSALPYLNDAVFDHNELVRNTILEAIEELENSNLHI
jgi:HEAT repeat protein